MVSGLTSTSVELSWSAPDDTARYKYAIYLLNTDENSDRLLGITGEHHFVIPDGVFDEIQGNSIELAVYTID